MDQSGELLVAVEGGVIKVRDVVRRTDPAERWNLDTFNKIVANPMWQPNPEAQDPEVHIEVRVPREEGPVIPISEPEDERRVYRFPIRARDAQRRGLWADRCLDADAFRTG